MRKFALLNGINGASSTGSATWKSPRPHEIQAQACGDNGKSPGWSGWGFGVQWGRGVGSGRGSTEHDGRSAKVAWGGGRGRGGIVRDHGPGVGVGPASRE